MGELIQYTEAERLFFEIVEESSMTHEIALLEASIFAGSKCIGN